MKHKHPRPRHAGTLGEFEAAVIESCVAQIVGHAGELGDSSTDDEHVHQLRVGLRRLRTALRELPGLSTLRHRHEAVLVQTFQRLGEHRDRTHVLETVRPAVEAAVGHALPPQTNPTASSHAAEIGARPGLHHALRALRHFAEDIRARERSVLGRGVHHAVEPRLDRLHARVVQDGRQFETLSQAQQHALRKGLKRLRYLAEFVQTSYGARATRRYLHALRPAQDALGRYHDECVAQDLYEQASTHDPRAQLGAQWLGTQRDESALACRASLRKLGRTQRFWTKRR